VKKKEKKQNYGKPRRNFLKFRFYPFRERKAWPREKGGTQYERFDSLVHSTKTGGRQEKNLWSTKVEPVDSHLYGGVPRYGGGDNVKCSTEQHTVYSGTKKKPFWGKAK